MPTTTTPELLSNFGRVLAVIADDPNVRLRDIATAVDLTERAVFGIVKDLIDSGLITVVKRGRRNVYTVCTDQFTTDAVLGLAMNGAATS